MSILIKDLPEDIKQVALQRQVEQGNKPDENVWLDVAFEWELTREGADIWGDIDDSDYTSFYTFRNTPLCLTRSEIAAKFGVNEIEIID